MRSVLRAILCSSVLATATGCFSYHRAATDRGACEPIPESAWEEQITDALRELETLTPQMIHRFAIDESVPADQRDPRASELAAHVVKRVTHSEIRSGGLLRLFEQPASEILTPPGRASFGPAGWSDSAASVTVRWAMNHCQERDDACP